MTTRRERVDVAYYTKVMRGLYALSPGKYTIWFVLNVMGETWDQAANIRLEIETEKAPSQFQHLRGLWKELIRCSKRMQLYYGNLHDPERLESHVVQPILFGNFPSDMLTEALEPTWTKTDVGYAGRPDVTQVAMLYNQAIVALGAFEDLWSDWVLYPLGTRLAEALMGAKRQLVEEAAPGEYPTMRDEVEQTIDDMIEGVTDMVTGDAAARLATLAFAVGGLALIAILAKK
jgi:hypothetical protein